MSNVKKPCPLCDGEVELRADRRYSLRYCGREYSLDGLEHEVCRDCGVSLSTDSTTERNNQRIKEFTKTIVKGIAPWEIRELRERYELSQEQARQIFDCRSPTQFSKWERGVVAPTAMTAKLLRMALQDPAVMRAAAIDAGIEVAIPGFAAELVHEVTAKVTGEVMKLIEDRVTEIYEAGHKDGHEKGRRAGLVQKVNLVLRRETAVDEFTEFNLETIDSGSSEWHGKKDQFNCAPN